MILIELTPMPGIKPHIHSINVYYDEEDDMHYVFVIGYKINQQHQQKEAFIIRYLENTKFDGNRIIWAFGKHLQSIEVTETFILSLSFDHIGNIYLLIGGIEFNKTNEKIKWMNQYLSENNQIKINDKSIQILIKFDKNLNVLFQHGYWPNNNNNNCNLKASLSIDKYDSVYLSQIFCNNNIFINKFNWKCPNGTNMDWEY